MTDYESLIPVAVDFHRTGHQVALITLIGNNGSSPRPLGSQMVVADDGRSAGYLTGGCAEAVIIQEALAAFTEGKSRHLRLGAGSPYMDVKLPCGAGIDLFIDIGLDDAALQELNDAVTARVPVALDTSMSGQSCHRCVFENTEPLPAESFRRWFYPRRRLLILGKGPNVPALARIATASEYDVMVMSPDSATLSTSEAAGAEVSTLSTPTAFTCPSMDPWTAAVLMFHEHDWEPVLLEAILASECFYIGALGSRRSHQQRLESLSEKSLVEAGYRLHGPVGLSIGAATPAEIALSVLAEVTRVYRQAAPALLAVGELKKKTAMVQNGPLSVRFSDSRRTDG